MANDNTQTLINKNKKLSKGVLWIIIINVVLWTTLAILLVAFNKPKNYAVPDKIKQDVITEISKADKYFSVNKIEMYDTSTINVWLEFKFEPKSQDEIKKWTLGFLDNIEKLNNYDVDMIITAMKPIDGTNKVKAYGRSSYYKDVGKLEYKPYE